MRLERTQHPQPVASRLGPRFYDWQLAQTPEESWRECHLYARNLLGEAGYAKLLEEIEPGTGNGKPGTGQDEEVGGRQSAVGEGNAAETIAGQAPYPNSTDEPERLVADQPAPHDLFGQPIATDLFGKPIQAKPPLRKRK